MIDQERLAELVDRWEEARRQGQALTVEALCHDDAELASALVKLSRHDDSRMCLLLLGAILENPGLAERLLQVLRPAGERRRSR